LQEDAAASDQRQQELQVTVANDDAAPFNELAERVKIYSNAKEDVYEAVMAHLKSKDLPPPTQLLLLVPDSQRPNQPPSLQALWSHAVQEDLHLPILRFMAIYGAHPCAISTS